MLILWDIDHTLLETRGVGGAIYADAFRAVTGVELTRPADVTGATEPVLFRANLDRHGLPMDGWQELFERFAERQAHMYRERVEMLRTQGRVLPGARETLARLTRRYGMTQTVLTGNTRQAAEVKLDAFDLAQFVRLDLGAYGTEADDRRELIALARSRSFNPDPAQVVLIADTPADMDAARRAGIHSLGVAMGKATAGDLCRAGAEHVVANLLHLPVDWPEPLTVEHG